MKNTAKSDTVHEEPFYITFHVNTVSCGDNMR